MTKHRHTVRMEQIDEPAPGTASVLAPSTLPAMTGVGDLDYLCGKCGAVLCERLGPSQIQFLVFKCPKCAAHNRVSSPNVV